MYYCILAGGKSRRMGQDKAFLKFKEGYLIEDIIQRFEQSGNKVCISSANGNLSEQLSHRSKPLKEIADLYKDIGPLGGIYSLLHQLKEDIFVMAVDMPLIDVRLVECMLKLSKGRPSVLQRKDGKIEPLFAFYTQSCKETALEQIQCNNYKMTDFIKKAEICCILEEDLEQLYGNGFENVIFNMNTPSDYEKVLDFISRV